MLKDPKKLLRAVDSTPRLEYALMVLGIAVVGFIAFRFLDPERATDPSAAIQKPAKRAP